MKNKLALFIAVILGLIAVYGISRYLGSKEEKFAEQHRTVLVTVAATRIPANTVIQANMLSPQGEAIPESVVTRRHILHRDRSTLVGQTINQNVERGTPLLSSYFLRPVERLEKKLDIGERALSLNVDTVSGVAGNLVPGSHVDILGTFPTTSGVGGKTSLTMLLLPNVTVLAVDNRTREMQYVTARSGARRSQYSAVTVAVTPKEANIILCAQQYGNLTLSLRSPADDGTGPAPTVHSGDELISVAAEAAREREERLKSFSPLTVKESL